MKDADKITLALQACNGRLAYKTLVAASGPKLELTMEMPNVVVSTVRG